MKTDMEMMTQAVQADPLNAAAVAALTDAMQENGVPESRVSEAVARIVLEARIADFVKYIDQIVIDYFTQRNYVLPPPTHLADFISDKWCRIVTVEHYQNGESRVGSVYCFVCLKDGYTKTLGTVTAGDIHMAAGFKKPAKHRRGSVFSVDFDKCAGPFGVNYLR